MEFEKPKCEVIELSERVNIGMGASLRFRFTEEYVLSSFKNMKLTKDEQDDAHSTSYG